MDRSPSFWRTWAKLRDHLSDQHRLVSKIMQLHLAVAPADGCAIRLLEKPEEELRAGSETLVGASSSRLTSTGRGGNVGVVPPTYRAESKRWERNTHAQVQLPPGVPWFARQLRRLQSSLGGNWTFAATLFHCSTVVPLCCQAAFIYQARRGATTARLSWRTIPLTRGK